MADDVQIIGLDKVASDTARWETTILPTVDREAASLESSLRQQLSEAVPFLTGTLSASAQVVPGQGDMIFGLGLGEGVPYAGWIEFGGSRGRELVPEGRYLYPIAQAAESQFDAIAERATTDSIEQFPWSTPS